MPWYRQLMLCFGCGTITVPILVIDIAEYLLADLVHLPTDFTEIFCQQLLLSFETFVLQISVTQSTSMSLLVQMLGCFLIPVEELSDSLNIELLYYSNSLYLF